MNNQQMPGLLVPVVEEEVTELLQVRGHRVEMAVSVVVAGTVVEVEVQAGMGTPVIIVMVEMVGSVFLLTLLGQISIMEVVVVEEVGIPVWEQDPALGVVAVVGMGVRLGSMD